MGKMRISVWGLLVLVALPVWAAPKKTGTIRSDGPLLIQKQMSDLVLRNQSDFLKCQKFEIDLRKALGSLPDNRPFQSQKSAAQVLTLLERVPPTGSAYRALLHQFHGLNSRSVHVEQVLKWTSEVQTCPVFTVLGAAKALMLSGKPLHWKSGEWSQLRKTLLSVTRDLLHDSHSFQGISAGVALVLLMGQYPELKVGQDLVDLMGDWYREMEQIRVESQEWYSSRAKRKLNERPNERLDRILKELREVELLRRKYYPRVSKSGV